METKRRMMNIQATSNTSNFVPQWEITNDEVEEKNDVEVRKRILKKSFKSQK